jgi:hypothetical protein
MTKPKELAGDESDIGRDVRTTGPLAGYILEVDQLQNGPIYMVEFPGGKVWISPGEVEPDPSPVRNSDVRCQVARGDVVIRRVPRMLVELGPPTRETAAWDRLQAAADVATFDLPVHERAEALEGIASLAENFLCGLRGDKGAEWLLCNRRGCRLNAEYFGRQITGRPVPPGSQQGGES